MPLPRPNARGPLLASAALLLAGALGCSSSSDNCIALPTATIAYLPPLLVGVSDSVTGAPVADLARGTMASLDESDSLRHWGYPPDSILEGVLGPGIFTVTVQRPGYATWVRRDVVIRAGNCGWPIEVRLTARLQPTP